ncbi:hypothetical protein B0H19DRAFT_1247670 [Mycena capillaripes]|nr:hypothetical protein B0H19DRAFT_1247670 [Mycena capillaripes]
METCLGCRSIRPNPAISAEPLFLSNFDDQTSTPIVACNAPRTLQFQISDLFPLLPTEWISGLGLLSYLCFAFRAYSAAWMQMVCIALDLEQPGRNKEAYLDVFNGSPTFDRSLASELCSRPSATASSQAPRPPRGVLAVTTSAPRTSVRSTVILSLFHRVGSTNTASEIHPQLSMCASRMPTQVYNSVAYTASAYRPHLSHILARCALHVWPGPLEMRLSSPKVSRNPG